MYRKGRKNVSDMLANFISTLYVKIGAKKPYKKFSDQHTEISTPYHLGGI